MKRLSVIMAAALVATSCTESGVGESNKYDNPNEVKIDVYASDPASVDSSAPAAVSGSRVAIDTPAGDTWTAGWEQYDLLAGWSQEDGSLNVFTQRTYASDKCQFAGVVNGDTYRLVYPNASVKDVVDGIYSMDLTTQAGDLSTTPMISNAIIDKNASSDKVFMQHIGAMASLVVDFSGVPAGVKLKSVILEAPAKADVDLTKGVDDADFYTNVEDGSIVIMPESAKAVSNGELSFNINLVPFTFAAGQELKVTVNLQDATGAACDPVETIVKNKGAEDFAIERAKNYELYCECNVSAAVQVETTTTIGELVAMLTKAEQTIEEINKTKELIFEAVITSSTLSNNVLSKYVMMQEPGSTEAGHGLSFIGATQQELMAIARTAGHSNGDSFGVKVRVTIKSVADGGSAFNITNDLYDGTIALRGGSVANITALGIEENFQPINVTTKIANLKKYQGMYVSVPQATLTATGTWGQALGSKMTLVPMKTASGSAFNVFVKGACSNETYGFVGKKYYPNEGSVEGTVLVHTGYGIAPRTIEDVEDFCEDSGYTPPVPSGLTTVSAIVSKVAASSGNTVTLNASSDVKFYAVITSSTIGNNVLHQMSLLQEADENGVVSKEPNSGLMMAGTTADKLKALAKTIEGNTTGDTFGLLVEVTIPAKGADGTPATITSATNEAHHKIIYATDNTTIMKAIKMVDMDEYVIDITDKLSSLKNYIGMYVTVPKANLTESGNWKDGTMNLVGAKTESGATFNFFIKKDLSNWLQEYAPAATYVPVFGTVASYQKSVGISPRYLSDVEAFNAE